MRLHITPTRGDSFYVSAPVLLDGKDHIVTVLVKRDTNEQRMYLHSVAIKESLLNRQVSRTDTASSVERSGSNDSGDSATLTNLQRDNKVAAHEVAAELHHWLELDISSRMPHTPGPSHVHVTRPVTQMSRKCHA